MLGRLALTRRYIQLVGIIIIDNIFFMGRATFVAEPKHVQKDMWHESGSTQQTRGDGASIYEYGSSGIVLCPEIHDRDCSQTPSRNQVRMLDFNLKSPAAHCKHLCIPETPKP